MLKGAGNTRQSALHRRPATRPPRPLLRLALPALVTALGAVTILTAAPRLTPRPADAPPPSWPTAAGAARPDYLIAHGVPVSPAVTAPAVAYARLGSSSRGALRAAAAPSPSPTPTLSPTPSPSPTPQRPVTYVVVAGDTIAGLAGRFGVTEETILWANDLAVGETLRVGQELIILPVSGVLHTVRAGDTLNTIARAYGAEAQAIIAANDLAAPDRLSIGQELVIPGGRPLPTPAPTPEPTAAPEPAATDPATEPAPTAPPDPAAASKGEEIAAIAARYLGYAYVYGGTSPETGFDCSGFAQFVYGQAGISIPRGLSGQLAAGPAVLSDGLRPGDLIFFQNTVRAGLSHVGIYVGGGRMIHASSPSVGVTTDDLSLPYWVTRYYSACRPW